MVDEEHGILTKNGHMFSLPHFHFKFKCVCMFGDLFLDYHLEYIS